MKRLSLVGRIAVCICILRLAKFCAFSMITFFFITYVLQSIKCVEVNFV